MFKGKITILILLALFLLGFSQFAHADQWAKTYGGGSGDYATSIQQTSDGGYIVAGETWSFGAGKNDAWVLKLDSSGNVSWQKTYGGSNYDIATSIQQTSDGGYIVAGYTYSFGAGYYSDAWVLKLDSSGNVSWQKTYGGSNYDYARSIQQTSDGGYIAAGYTQSFGAGGSDAWVLKLDSSGNVSWQKTYGGSSSDYADSIQQTSDGGYIVAGNTQSFGAGGSDAWVLKLDSSGNVSWQKTYGGSNSDSATSIRQSSDGGYIVAAVTESFGAGVYDAWILKLDSSGNVLQQKTYGGSHKDNVRSIQLTSDGGYIVAGETEPFDSGGYYDTWVLKFDSSGNGLWLKTYGGSSSDYALSIQQTSDGSYIVAGYTGSFGAGSWDAWVLKLDGNGQIIGCLAVGSSSITVSNTGITGVITSVTGANTSVSPVTSTATPATSSAADTGLCYYPSDQWAKIYGTTYYDYAGSIQQTSDGGYIVAGDTYFFGAGGSDFWVLKLSSSGNVSWQKTYGGSSYDIAHSIQQTSDGGYIVAGDTYSFGAGEYDAWVLKLDSSGNVSWQKTYGGSSSDVAHSIQQTSDGGYIVAGDTYSFGAGSWVLKLDGSGNVIWQKTYGGSSSGHANSIQQTSDGGYIVAGYTLSFGAGNEFWVLKLNSSGNVSWQKTYGGSSDDYANSIQQTRDGGYIVAGYTSSFGAGLNDVWALKLDASGNVSWQKTYGGSNEDSAYSIRQTSDGGYIVAGDTSSFGAGDVDAWVLKLDSSGNVSWQKTYDGSNSDSAHSIQQTSDGGYIVACYNLSFGAWVLKLNAGGDIIDCSAEGTSTAVVSNTSVTGNNAIAIVSSSSASPLTSTATPANTNATETEVCYYGYPNISVSPISHDFGNVNVGSTSTRTFTISNTGTADLLVSSISMAGGDSGMFSVMTGGMNPCPGLTPTLTSGSSCTIVAAFSPTSGGLKSTDMRIISNDPDPSTLDIPLAGTGNLLLCGGKVVTIVGTAGADNIAGTAGPDVIHGLGGNDTINGMAGNDVICGGAGKDTLYGGEGKDRLFGGGGNDSMDGGLGTDTCNGGAGTGDTAVNCETVIGVP